LRTSITPLAPLSPLTYHILAALKARNLHAYGLLQQVAHDSGFSITTSTGSLHHTLKALTDRRLIEPLGPDPITGRHTYRLTPGGEKAFAQELKRLKRAVTIGTLADKGVFTWQ
jgi:DNA-binding PadR family transcriptional regulator